MAFRDPEMATPSARRGSTLHRQIILRRLESSATFRAVSYLAGSQWNLERQPYRILQFLDENGGVLGRTSHTHVIERTGRRVESEIFASNYPLRLQHGTFSGLQWGSRLRDLRRIRVRILAADETLYLSTEEGCSVCASHDQPSGAVIRPKKLQAYTKRKTP